MFKIETDNGQETKERQCEYGQEITLRLSNPSKEDGATQEPGPLNWLNSARMIADYEEDALHCLVSVGDPRGAFCFTVRRLSDGRLVIHTPYPEETSQHESTKELWPGTQVVVHYGTDKPINFAAIEEDEE